MKHLNRVQRKFSKPLQTVKSITTRYMEPSYYQKPLAQEEFPRTHASRPRSITWICLPFFSLERYSGIHSVTQSGDYPIRTLLQARFTGARKDRDMQQAICSLPDTSKGHCVHIAQIWCLVLDDSLLITCARLSLASLQGQSITVNSAPVPDTPKKHSLPRILVSYGDAVMWSFAVSDCQTWFALLSHFFEFWPRRFRLQHNGNLLSPAYWPRLVRSAEDFGRDIFLHFELGSAHDGGQKPKAPAADAMIYEDSKPPEPRDEEGRISGAESKAKPGPFESGNATDILGQKKQPDEAHYDSKPSFESQQPAGVSWSSKNFHVFLWLHARGSQDSTNGMMSPAVRINDTLKSIDEFLSKETSPSERLVYSRCPDYTQSAALALFEDAESIAPGAKLSKAEQRDHEQKVEVVHAALSVFSFFLPQHYKGPTITKFWGAIREVLAVCRKELSLIQ